MAKRRKGKSRRASPKAKQDASTPSGQGPGAAGEPQPAARAARKRAASTPSAAPAAIAAPATTRWALIAGIAVLFGLALENAWVTEDAYISFRTLDNLVHGYGLRWNVTERVQSFTHPLWLLLHVPFYFVTREAFLTSIAISLACTTFALWLGTRALQSQRWWVALLALAPLGLSQAFIDYSTSGLENPLTHLLLAWFTFELTRAAGIRPLHIALTASLGAVNRPDTILFVGPALLLVLAQDLSWQRIRTLALGFSPLVAWEIFSLFYYGFLFPNSRYAKLATNVPSDWYWLNGRLYLLSIVREDPVSACIIVGGLVLGVLATIDWLQGRGRASEHAGKLALLATGMAIHCAYVVKVGGDFMQGRFFTGSVFMSMLLLWQAIPPNASWPLPAPAARRFVSLFVLLLLFAGVRQSWRDEAWYNGRIRITDERKYYEKTNTLHAYLEGRSPATNGASKQGQRKRKEAAERRAQGDTRALVWTHKYVGMRGYFAGPDVVLIGQLGLTDPLMARLGVMYPRYFRVGHGERQLPEGYVQAHESGSLDAMDPALAEYYAALRSVIAGPLFDTGRLATIARLNLGQLDHLIRSYERRAPPPPPLEFQRRKKRPRRPRAG